MSGAVLHPPGAGETLSMGPSTITIKAGGDQTGGSFFISESEIAPGFAGPPLHTHVRLHDMFYVLQGTLTVRLGDEVHEAGPGTFVCVPPGTPHTFSNPSTEPVRFLNMNTPSGWEDYMRDLAAAAEQAGGPLDPARIGEIASRYDFKPV